MHIAGDLLRACRAGDHAGYRWLGQEPAEGELQQRDAARVAVEMALLLEQLA